MNTKQINTKNIQILIDNKDGKQPIIKNNRCDSFLQADRLECKLVNGQMSFVLCLHRLEVMRFSCDHKIDWKKGETLTMNGIIIYIPVEGD